MLINPALAAVNGMFRGYFSEALGGPSITLYGE